MIVNTISRRYAGAIYRASISFNALEKVYKDLNELSDKINAELTQFYGKYSRVDDHTTLIIEKI